MMKQRRLWGAKAETTMHKPKEETELEKKTALILRGYMQSSLAYPADKSTIDQLTDRLVALALQRKIARKKQWTLVWMVLSLVLGWTLLLAFPAYSGTAGSGGEWLCVLLLAGIFLWVVELGLNGFWSVKSPENRQMAHNGTR